MNSYSSFTFHFDYPFFSMHFFPFPSCWRPNILAKNKLRTKLLRHTRTFGAKRRSRKSFDRICYLASFRFLGLSLLQRDTDVSDFQSQESYLQSEIYCFFVLFFYGGPLFLSFFLSYLILNKLIQLPIKEIINEELQTQYPIVQHPTEKKLKKYTILVTFLVQQTKIPINMKFKPFLQGHNQPNGTESQITKLKAYKA